MGKNVSHYIISITNVRKTYIGYNIGPKYLHESFGHVLVSAA